MLEIIIYTADRCPYCTMAKRLLNNKSVNYKEINVDAEPGLRSEMVRKTNRRTVPQIFIGTTHVGGFDELYALDRSQQLDPLLAKA